MKSEYNSDDNLTYFISKDQAGNIDYNLENNRIVRLAIDVLNRNEQVVDPFVIDQALKTKMRGRLEEMNDRIIYDGGHNPAGITKAISTFISKYSSNRAKKLFIL